LFRLRRTSCRLVTATRTALFCLWPVAKLANFLA
jgi:hypothetical protein